MMTIKEASRLAGVSIRTLQYYDKIGLLHPTGYTESGYRLYDDAALETLQQILLFRELEFPLKEIKEILSSLGEMYAGDGEFKANIDKAGGEGTAQFAAEAIKVYCGK